MAAIRLRGVVKRFGAVTVIPPLDLDIRDREFVVIVGPSGCGKSTLLRMIAGLEPLDAGELHIGEDRVNGVAAANRDIAMVFQDYALYPHMTVYENMAFALEMRRMPREEIDARVRRAAAMLRIDPYLDRKPRALSGGQRQRVAMGRAMVRNPRAFLFDEPLSNLDAKLRADVRTEIKALAQQLATTMVFVTHDQVEAMTMADRIVILRAGTIQQIGTPEDVYRRPANRFVAGFIGSPTMNFFDVTIEGERALLADGTPVAVSSASIAAAHRAVLTRAVLGVRPEHLLLQPADATGIKLAVHVVEPLGSDTLLYFGEGATRHVARVPPDVPVKPGDAVVLGVAPGKAHLFAPGDDGVALGEGEGR